MTEAIRIVVDPRLEEHLQAERLLFAHAPWRHPGRIAAVLLLGVAGFGSLRNGLGWGSILGLCVGMFFVAFPFALKDVRTWVLFKLGWGMREAVRMEFGEAGVHVRMASVDTELRWSTYTGLLEDAQLLLLTYGGQGYTVLPKRCFASPDQVEDFRALVARRLQHTPVVPSAG